MERNAIILAAGTSSRFVPLSLEIPKGLLEVKGEILVERQIRQLREADVRDITVVVGYMAEKFRYLAEKFGVELVYNDDFSRYNNTSSMVRVLDRLGDTYICSSDNYFPGNVFRGEPDASYYSALYAGGPTREYCLRTDSDGNITDVTVGGRNSWYMVGHVYFSEGFSSAFRPLLRREYDRESTRHEYWEDVYIRNIVGLPPMRVNRYREGEIEEFDSIDELRKFDSSYIRDTRSTVLKGIAAQLGCRESDLSCFHKMDASDGSPGFTFRKGTETYLYNLTDDTIIIQ